MKIVFAVVVTLVATLAFAEGSSRVDNSKDRLWCATDSGVEDLLLESSSMTCSEKQPLCYTGFALSVLREFTIKEPIVAKHPGVVIDMGVEGAGLDAPIVLKIIDSDEFGKALTASGKGSLPPLEKFMSYVEITRCTDGMVNGWSK